MADLRVNVAGVEFQNPLIAASGTFGFGREYNEFYPLSALGGISCKGITIKERPGNPPPRVTEAPGGMLNAVGLQNPGVDHFIEHDLPWLSKQGTKIIANVAGNAPEDYCATVEKLNDTCVDMIELNISCPNVHNGGMAFGVTPEGAAEVTRAVKAVTKKPVIMKLSPNVTDIAAIARSCEAAGADGISLINTVLSMRIDLKTKKPVVANVMGGLSGPAVFPLALRMVWQVCEAVSIPVVGMGGVSSAEDVIEMMLAGAAAVEVGAANLVDPCACQKIVRDLPRAMEQYGINDLKEIIGGARHG